MLPQVGRGQLRTARARASSPRPRLPAGLECHPHPPPPSTAETSRSFSQRDVVSQHKHKVGRGKRGEGRGRQHIRDRRTRAFESGSVGTEPGRAAPRRGPYLRTAAGRPAAGGRALLPGARTWAAPAAAALQAQVSGGTGSEAGSGSCMQISTGARKPQLTRLPVGSESTAEESLYFLKQKPPSFTRKGHRPIRRQGCLHHPAEHLLGMSRSLGLGPSSSPAREVPGEGVELGCEDGLFISGSREETGDLEWGGV